MELAVTLLGAYLIGSIPFGLILTRLAGLGDIRAIGSGNIGATNVLRTGRKGLAALTLFLDGFKGFAVALAAQIPFPIWINVVDPAADCMDLDSGLRTACFHDVLAPLWYIAPLAAVLVVVGHMFPIWLKFKGGKGVATTLGAALGLNPFVGAAACATWLIMAVVFRYSSLAALVAVATLPGYAWYLKHNEFIIPLAIIAVLVWLRHHENIKRLLAGTEPKIGAKK